jgi:ankyrin repeat protein
MGCEFAQLLRTDSASQGGVPGIRKEAIRTLVEQGADPDAKDSSGLTPADATRRWNKAAAIKVLARAA